MINIASWGYIYFLAVLLVLMMVIVWTGVIEGKREEFENFKRLLKRADDDEEKKVENKGNNYTN